MEIWGDTLDQKLMLILVVKTDRMNKITAESRFFFFFRSWLS